MRVISKFALAAVALAAYSTTASAAVTLADHHAFDNPATRLGPGETLVWNFNTTVNPVENSLFTYTGQVHIGNSANMWAAPTGDHSHYGIATDIPATKGGPTDASFSIASGYELTSFSAYLGSIDNYNTLSFLNGKGDVVQSYTGDQLAQLITGNPAAVATSSTTSADSNQRMFFTFGKTDDITKVLFQSDGRAFEFDNFAASWISVVPEPATWAMMILGFGFIGFMMRGSRQKASTISA